MDVVKAWVDGQSFANICKMTSIYEGKLKLKRDFYLILHKARAFLLMNLLLVPGSIVRCIRRLEELLRQMCGAAKAIGNQELEAKFLEGLFDEWKSNLFSLKKSAKNEFLLISFRFSLSGTQKIKRDIIFAASLYLWWKHRKKETESLLFCYLWCFLLLCLFSGRFWSVNKEFKTNDRFLTNSTWNIVSR